MRCYRLRLGIPVLTGVELWRRCAPELWKSDFQRNLWLRSAVIRLTLNLKNIRLTKEYLHLLFTPTLCWKCLQKHHGFLKTSQNCYTPIGGPTYLEIHLLKLIRPLDQECRTNI